jgi:2-dehydro-3-deoxyphosphogluconate aldolase/(4S)-4-hydroxy-2-oxoglutarate aldolase
MKSPFSKPLFESVPIVGILRGLEARWLAPVVEAVGEGGLTNLEITMNTSGATDQIKAAVALVGTRMNIGAGTVTSLGLLEQALEAGATFIVTPIVREDVILRCVELGVPVFPGAFTPTEIARAWDLGAALVKVFPAEVLGPAYIRSVKAPLSEVRLMPTGGIDLETLAEYQRAGASAFGVGTPLFRASRIAEGDWPWLRQRAAAFVEALQVARE